MNDYDSKTYIKELQEEIAKLKEAIRTLRAYAAKTHDYWDASEDHKVGKRLAAMAGAMKGIYSAEVDAALELAE